MKVRFYDINWDTDGDPIDILPQVVECDTNLEDEEDVSLNGADVLSDRYGFCVNSFSFEIKE